MQREIFLFLDIDGVSWWLHVLTKYKIKTLNRFSYSKRIKYYV